MNIINVMIKEMKQNLRSKKSLIMMILYPIVLMVVLGTALSGAFDSSAGFSEINVLYTNPGGTPLAQAFQGFVARSQEMGMVFTLEPDREQGMQSIKSGAYACYVIVSGARVELVKNDSQAFRGILVETMLSTFTRRYNAVYEIAKANPAMAGEIMNRPASGDYVKTSSLSERKQPRALDYYAITMLTLIILYGSTRASYAIFNEKLMKTESRLYCAPVKKSALLLGKILGMLLITMLQVIIVVVFCKYLLGTYWGSHLGTVLLLLTSEVVFAVSLGIGMAFMARGEVGPAIGILNLIIPFLVFLGGGYVPIDSFGKTILMVANISPIKWINSAIFQVIYNNDFGTVLQSVLINVGLAVGLLVFAFFCVRKEVA